MRHVEAQFQKSLGLSDMKVTEQRWFEASVWDSRLIENLLWGWWKTSSYLLRVLTEDTVKRTFKLDFWALDFRSVHLAARNLAQILLKLTCSLLFELRLLSHLRYLLTSFPVKRVVPPQPESLNEITLNEWRLYLAQLQLLLLLDHAFKERFMELRLVRTAS